MLFKHKTPEQKVYIIATMYDKVVGMPDSDEKRQFMAFFTRNPDYEEFCFLEYSGMLKPVQKAYKRVSKVKIK